MVFYTEPRSARRFTLSPEGASPCTYAPRSPPKLSAPITPLDATLPQVLILKEFKSLRINTYKKPIGGCMEVVFRTQTFQPANVPTSLSSGGEAAHEFLLAGEQVAQAGAGGARFDAALDFGEF